MKIRRHQVIITILVVLGLTFLVIGIFYQQEPVKYYAHSLRTWQEADSVAGYPIAINGSDEESPPEFLTTEFQPNLSTLSAMERFRLPTARSFVKPPPGEARAAATGLVLYTGNPEGYEGLAVLLGHRLPGGSIVQTFYHGLSGIEVKVGQHVPRGASLGEGGALSEIRAGSSIDIAREEIGGVVLNSQDGPTAPNRMNLRIFFAKYGVEKTDPDPLLIIQENQKRETREQLGIGVE